MIRHLLRFCLRERLLVLLALLGSLWLGWDSFQTVPLDAVPNVGENQVIVLSEWPGRSPQDLEDQVTYPLSLALQAVPGATSVRGRSMFGISFVQITFDDSVDLYWARSRVSEQLSTVAGRLPEQVVPALAPDATALGQIFYYVLDAPPGRDLAELRSQQDFFVRYALQSVEGVAEVASIGGYVRQYQVDVNPDQLRFHQLQLQQVIQAVRDSNIDVSARTVEDGGMEFIVRGRGFIGAGRSEAETIAQIRETVVVTRDGVPIRIQDVADVQSGPSFRRGALDFNGREAVGGVVVMRHGENPRAVIQRVRERIQRIEPELDGTRIRAVYDRTGLIDETVGTLTTALQEETAVTIAVVILFLLHVRSSLIIAITLPTAVLMAFSAMKLFGVDANIMSLAGIAIAIGTMVDMGIIVLENIYNALAEWEQTAHLLPRTERETSRINVIQSAAEEVVPSVMTAVSTTIVSFLPVFFLTGRDYRLFAPLAWTKTYALAASLIVAITIVPMLSRLFFRTIRWQVRWSLLCAAACSALTAGLGHFVWQKQLTQFTGMSATACTLLTACIGLLLSWTLLRERLRPLSENPASRLVLLLYAGRLRLALKQKMLMLTLPLLLLVLGTGAWLGLPRVLRPVEQFAAVFGADLTRLPGYSNLLKTLPGLRSDDWIALDEGSWFYMPSLLPAASFSQSLEILQSQDVLIGQIPEVADVLGKIGRVESALDPAPAAMVETYVMLKPVSEWRPGITADDIWEEINAVATLPGVTPAAPLQPIEGRVVMLQSGIRASMAIRIFGDSLEQLNTAAERTADFLRMHPLVNSDTVNPDIVLGKPYYEFEVSRQEAARYGMTTLMVNQIVSAGLGGVDATTTYEGRERYPVQVRFSRDVRDDIDDLPRIPVVTPTGDVVPLERLAEVSTTWGPGVISSENSRLVAHVMFAPSGSGDLETVEAVMAAITTARSDGRLQFPNGNFEVEAVGAFRNQLEANQRLMWIIPGVFLINLLLHYLHFRSLPVSLIVFSGIPIACAGGMIAVAWAGVELNTAVWVGFIALAGFAADDGIVMASYIQQRVTGRHFGSIAELQEEVFQAGLRRIRPCVMTTLTTICALLPVLTSTGRGSDVAQAMAWPVLGGMLIEPFTTFVVPAIYCAWLELQLCSGLQEQPASTLNQITRQSP